MGILENFKQPIPASFYKKIQQTMQIQEISRASKEIWISLEFLESAWILLFSGKSLLKEREVEIRG